MKRNVKRHEVIQPLDQSIKFIPLTQGYITAISAHRFAEHSKHHWHAIKDRKNVYAVRNSLQDENGKRHLIYLHREILGLMHGSGREITEDHKNTADTLNNTDENLRLANATEQCRNQRARTFTSKYKGVYWFKINKKWGAHITINKKRKFLGLFIEEIKAAEAYDESAIHNFGEFAQLNFPVHVKGSST